MKIGILKTGEIAAEMLDEYVGYDKMFTDFLSGRGFEFKIYNILHFDFPKTPYECDGWIITGSRCGVYEDHKWIPPLEDFIRTTYSKEVPIFAVCFGHQILAQALGGKVEKFKGGWSVGVKTYNSRLFGDQILIGWHQDQVIKPPSEAIVDASTIGCENAILVYPKKALSIQPHPEFTPKFAIDLLDLREDILPDELSTSARKSMQLPLTSSSFANVVEKFFKLSK